MIKFVLIPMCILGLMHIVARLNDHPRKPPTEGRLALVMHHAFKWGMVCIGMALTSLALKSLAGYKVQLPEFLFAFGLVTCYISDIRFWQQWRWSHGDESKVS